MANAKKKQGKKAKQDINGNDNRRVDLQSRGDAAITIQAHLRGFRGRRAAMEIAEKVEAQQLSSRTIMRGLDEAWLEDRREARRPGYIQALASRHWMSTVQQRVLTRGASAHPSAHQVLTP